MSSSASASASSSVGAGMAFDGTSSDIARQLYYRAKANDSVSQLVLDQVPAAVQSRLEDLNLDWNKLPGIAQRAVLWDTGYAFTLQNTAVQVWTLGNHTMADLALTVDEYEGAGCVPMNCTEPDNTVMYANLYCNGAQMDNAAKCVVQEFDDDNSYHAAMWSTGGNPVTAPTPRVSKHVWFDQGANVSYAVMAVHTVSIENEPSYSVCPAGYQNGGYGSVVFPCRTTANITDEDKAEMQVVQGSAWLSQWLVEDYPEAVLDPGSDFDPLLLIPIILGGIILLALVGLAIYCCKRRRRRSMQNTNELSSNQNPSPSPSPISYLPYMTSPPMHADMRNSKTRRATEAASEHLTSATYSGSDQSTQFPDGYTEYGSNSTLKILLTSEFLVGKRIPVESLNFERALSKGASGEVWLCDYAGQQVAAKRLLQTKVHKVEDVHEFAEEIELNASLEHKNISTFIGVSWSRLNSLTMVTEYFPVGDLQGYLRKNNDLLSWARDKIHMAVGVAQALEYLHGRETPIIHRDLKSRNVLLTRRLEAKVIDFGVSRGRLDNTMTGGVGTPYWTAPEILEGKRYTEQADIYSFGVVLCELDTGRLPFSDFDVEEGQRSKPFHILQRVISGSLRPSFSEECPPRISRVGEACSEHDPALRPTAAQLVRMLQGDE